MTTASPEPGHESKADEYVLKLLSMEGNSASSNDHTTPAVEGDSGSSKEDGGPLDNKPEDKPLVLNIDPSGLKSPSLIALHHLGPHFKDYITLNSLHPYLNKHNLLTSNEDATLMLPTITDVDKILQLVSWLPRKGPDFLDKFIECLHDSSETSQGTAAHRELADQLNMIQTAAEKKLRELGEEIETDFPTLEPRNGTSKHDDKVAKDHPLSSTPAAMDPECVLATQKVSAGIAWPKYCSAKCVVFYSLYAVVTAILTIVTFVLLARLPQFDEKEIRPRTVREGMTVELSFGISTKLLENGSLGINNNCYGCLYIISGVQCEDLYDEYTSNITNNYTMLEYNWLLPGSYIEYTLAANASVEMWLYMDESMPGCNTVRQYECSEYPSICHQLQNQNETPVIQTIQITESGNYFLCFDPINQNAIVHSITYDNAKIVEDFGTGIDFEMTMPFSFENRFLKYTPSCVLANVECIGNNVGQFSGRVSKRNDTVFFGVFVLLLSFAVLFVLVSVHVCICLHKHTSLHKSFSA